MCQCSKSRRQLSGEDILTLRFFEENKCVRYLFHRIGNVLLQWLRDELARTVQIFMPPLPSKAYVKQLPFLTNDDGIFEPEFVEERRLGLEVNNEQRLKSSND